MTGGMIWPPVEATASMAPATWALYPVSFIRGMVNVPVVTTLEAALPEMVPIRALEITAALAGPPRVRPVSAMAISMKNLPPPVASRKQPNRINMITTVAAVPIGVPKMPFVPTYRWETIRVME